MKHYLLGALLLFTIGCGGGGGTSGITSVVTPSPTLRTPTPGDSWTYSISGHVPAGNFGGTLVESMSSESFNGISAIRDTQAITITSGVNTGNVGITNQWDSMGATSYHIVGLQQSGGAISTVVSTTYIVPLTITSSLSISGQTTFNDGLVIDSSTTVTGAEIITVPAGTFKCWKITRAEQHNDGSTFTSTEWWPAEYGAFVKRIENGSDSSGNHAYTQLLTSTNVRP